MIIIGLVVGMVISDIALVFILIQLHSVNRSMDIILRNNQIRDELIKQLLSNQQDQEELNKITIMAISDLQDRVKNEDRAIIFNQKMGEA
jgi:hypothetical protein